MIFPITLNDERMEIDGMFFDFPSVQFVSTGRKWKTNYFFEGKKRIKTIEVLAGEQLLKSSIEFCVKRVN